MSAGRIGCMTTPAQGSRIPEGALYACDNSKFGSDGKGRYWPGAQAWFAWLHRTVERYGPDRCLWALAPDQPFDAAGTLTESLPWLARIRELGVPAAYAAQDGCDTPGLLPWDDFDVLFLAGSTEWKLGPVAERLAREAKARGKGVHMGRVNSRIRLGIAEWFGCDSADGTYLAFGPDKNLPKLLSWLDELDGRPSLVGGTHPFAAPDAPSTAPPPRADLRRRVPPGHEAAMRSKKYPPTATSDVAPALPTPRGPRARTR
ncbi:hypothetical protein [Streptomyces sp. P3]|uniref:hypothetical protein n=1 Tax=Streptomyces sp. P3 TaxID=2135430 RepID=UPI001574ED88|nr:hypothetical protein [Streptomyces sp. P3]